MTLIEGTGTHKMAFEAGEIRVFNPNKEISKEITLEILIRHRDALKQARTGDIVGIDPNTQKISDNDRKLAQVRGLNLIISAQREMVTVSRPIIFFKSMQGWKKKFKENNDQLKNPFNKQENDYSKLKEWLEFLTNCANELINAERTASIEDDFLIVRRKEDGDISELTDNFYSMVEDLESSYEQIYLLMLTNKIVSAGIEEDEELTYKQKEQEAINRVKDA